MGFYISLCREAKQDYYGLKIVECGNDQKKMVKIANDLNTKRNDTSLPTIASSQELAEIFADFFTDKIAKIRESLNNMATSEELYMYAIWHMHDVPH